MVEYDTVTVYVVVGDVVVNVVVSRLTVIEREEVLVVKIGVV